MIKLEREREELTTRCTERGEYKRGWEGAVLTGAQDKMKALLTTYSQKELIFSEFPWNFPITTHIPFSVYMLKIRSFPSSSFNPMTKKYFYLHLQFGLGVTITQPKVRNLPFSPTQFTEKDNTYHSGCLSGNSVYSPSIGDAFKLLLNYCLYFSRQCFLTGYKNHSGQAHLTSSKK